MAQILSVDPRDPVPIWKQVEEGVRRLVVCRALPPGAPVPSVRELAADLRINPATVVKAYQRLTEEGFLVVKRGEGTFVADAPPAIGKQEKARSLKEGAAKYASLAVRVGGSPGEAADALRSAFTELQPRGNGGRP